MTRFVVDAMLGTLAKWLRVLGFDTIFAKGMQDKEIVELAKAEDRLLITRDRDLAKSLAGSIYLKEKNLDEQLAIILKMHPADRSRVLTRCLECNSSLNRIEKSQVEGVPKGVLEREKEFWQCPGCKKIYWPATHWKNMMRKAERFLSE
jgi:uncharacterized protein with PIN domain